MKKRNLILITAEFPYGSESEIFLENEVSFLSSHFDKVIILPRKILPNLSNRRIPKNCQVLKIISNYRKKFLFNYEITVVIESLYQLLRQLLSRNFWKSLTSITYYLAKVPMEVKGAKEIALIIKNENLGKPIVYTYWSFGNTLSIAILRKKNFIAKAVSRCHGYDLYDERWKIGHLPFRNEMMAQFDAIHPVSKHGEGYLRRKSLGKHHHKISYSYLGTVERIKVASFSSQTESLLISCSSLIPLKRVSLIPKILKKIDRPMKWIHFGSGPCLLELENACLGLPKKISWEIKGHVTNQEILQFYEHNNISCFLSTSESEGLPYSIIEAASFGIPVLACDVGGVAEIVNEETGRLLCPEPRIDLWAKQIEEVLIGTLQFDRDKIIALQKKNFSADKNYQKFAQSLTAELVQ